MATLMFVDDDDNMVAASVSLARLLHHTHFAFHGAHEALAELVEIQPDVLFSDLTMPRMNGFELASAIRGDAALRHIYLAAISSHDSRAYRTAAARAGFDAYFVKPLTPEAILSSVEADRLRRAAAAVDRNNPWRKSPGGV